MPLSRTHHKKITLNRYLCMLETCLKLKNLHFQERFNCPTLWVRTSCRCQRQSHEMEMTTRWKWKFSATVKIVFRMHHQQFTVSHKICPESIKTSKNVKIDFETLWAGGGGVGLICDNSINSGHTVGDQVARLSVLRPPKLDDRIICPQIHHPWSDNLSKFITHG